MLKKLSKVLSPKYVKNCLEDCINKLLSLVMNGSLLWKMTLTSSRSISGAR